MAEKKPFRVGLVGFGNIGTGFVRQYLEHGALMAERMGRPVELAAIADREFERPRGVTPPATTKLTTNWRDITGDPTIDMVVELVGVGADGRPTLAFEIAKAALTSGKHFTTANKALLATHGPELEEAAEAGGALLFYEATVGAGTPTIGPMQTNLVSDQIVGVHGIVNGTTNYILTRMEEDPALALEAAIREAQELGYAEPDPTSDVEGDDAVYKIAILGSLAFGCRILPVNVQKLGITRLSPIEISVARERGWALKLVASARLHANGHVAAAVRPVFLPADHIMAAVRGVFNAVLIEADPQGTTMYYGPGAGQSSTASGLWSDCVMAARHPEGGANLFPLKLPAAVATPVDAAEARGRHYLRVPAEMGDQLAMLLGSRGEAVATPATHRAFLTGELSEADVDNLLGKLCPDGVFSMDVCHVKLAFFSA